MKTGLLAATALAAIIAASLAPAMANRLGPDDTRMNDWSDMLGQNGVNAATPTPDGHGYVWEYHYGHNGSWEGHWVPESLSSGPHHQ
jgi:hypothetical protein